MLLYNFHFNFILFAHIGRANFGFLDVQYLQNVVFSIEIGWMIQITPQQIFTTQRKNFLPSPKFPTSPLPPIGWEISSRHLSFLIKGALGHKEWFLISAWKYWIWISKNESILRTTAWKGFDYSSIRNCVRAVTLFQLDKIPTSLLDKCKIMT